MLRLHTDDGWWLITHPEHARLAGEFAARWGNALFRRPAPRGPVLHAIYAHDDGWAARDAQPVLTSKGEPAGFSTDLVGKYSAFEEIDLQAYLAVRGQAVQLIAQQDPYAAILISMHTYNLLSERADRSTIRTEQLPLLDAFLVEQKALQQRLREQLLRGEPGTLTAEDLSQETLHRHFQLLQACDNLSLISCVNFQSEATLLHPFDLRDGRPSEVQVAHVAERSFRLSPYPFEEDGLKFKLQARFVPGRTFSSAQELQDRFASARLNTIEVEVSA